MKTNEELFAYCVQMRERGDTYRSMANYLNNNCEDEETIKSIVTAVNKLEKENRINSPKINKEKTPTLSLLLGTLFLVSGIVLMFFFWGMGVIFTVPFILISIGILALTGSIK